jgi:hypothetical protein
MNARRRLCSEQTTIGRLRKAIQFLEAADTIQEFADDAAQVGDAFATLCVHAGIAAADALCCAVLGEHAQGDEHAQATALLQRVRPDGSTLATALAALLAVKTRAGYSALPVSGEQRARAHRRAMQLVDAARKRVGTQAGS